MNRQFEQRLRRLEQRQAHPPGKSKKRILPEWLLHTLHEETGLPLDTDEMALDSIRRIQTRAAAPRSESFKQT